MGVFGEAIYGHVGQYKTVLSSTREYENQEGYTAEAVYNQRMSEGTVKRILQSRNMGGSDKANQIIMLDDESGYTWTLWTAPQNGANEFVDYSHLAYWKSSLSVLEISERDLVYYPFLNEEDCAGYLGSGRLNIIGSEDLRKSIDNRCKDTEDNLKDEKQVFEHDPWQVLVFYIVENLKRRERGFLRIIVPVGYKGANYQFYCQKVMSCILRSIPDGLRKGLSFATNPSRDLEGSFGIVFRGAWMHDSWSNKNELRLENKGAESFLASSHLSEELKGIISIWNEGETKREQIRSWQKTELRNKNFYIFDAYAAFYKRRYAFPKTLEELIDLVEKLPPKEQASVIGEFIAYISREGKNVKDVIKEEGLLQLRGNISEDIKATENFLKKCESFREDFKKAGYDLGDACLELLKEAVVYNKANAVDNYKGIVGCIDMLKELFKNLYGGIASIITELRDNAWRGLNEKLPKDRTLLTKEAINGWNLDKLSEEYNRLIALDETICGDSDLRIKKVKEEDSGHQGERQNGVIREYTSTKAWCDRISCFEALKAIYQLLDKNDEKSVLERLNKIPDGDIPVQKAVICAIVKKEWKQITTVVFEIYTKCQSFRAWEERGAFEDKKTGFVNECLEWAKKAKEAEIPVIIRCARNIIDSNVKERLYEAIKKSEWFKKKVEQGSAIEIVRIALIFPQVIEELRNSDKIPEYLRDFIGVEDAFYYVKKEDDDKDGMLATLYAGLLGIIVSSDPMTLYIKKDTKLSEFYRLIGNYAERTKRKNVDIIFNRKTYKSLGVEHIEEVLRCSIELANGNDADLKVEISEDIREFFLNSGLLKGKKKKKVKELFNKYSQTSSRSTEEEHIDKEIKEGNGTTNQKPPEGQRRLDYGGKQGKGLPLTEKIAITLLVVSLAVLALVVVKWRNTLNNKTDSEVTVSGNSHMEESGEYNERIDPTSIQGFSSDDTTISFAESISTENSDGSSLSEHEEFVDNGSMDESEVSSRKIEAARSRYADIKDANGQSLAEALANRDQTGDIRSIPMGDGYNIDGRENPDRDLEAIRGEDSGLLGFGFRRDNGEDLYAVWDGNEIKGYSLTDGGEIVSEKVFDENGNLLGHDLDHDGRADIGIDLDHTIVDPGQ